MEQSQIPLLAAVLLSIHKASTIGKLRHEETVTQGEHPTLLPIELLSTAVAEPRNISPR